MNDYKRNTNMMEQDSRIGDVVSGRGSSKYGTQTANGNAYGTGRGDQARYDQGASTRDSLRSDAANPSATGQSRLRTSGMDGYNGGNVDGLSSQQYGESPSSPRGGNRYTLGSQDAAARGNNTSIPPRQDSLPLTRKPLPTSPTSPSQLGHNSGVSGGRAAATGGNHLRLPEGFNLQNSEVTHVTEEYRPAVTREAVLHERREIIQEEITRDIHIHHYYTYIQPIRVVDVLPPKHYFLDVQTGVKTQIQTPVGWQMPMSVAPMTPDVTMIKAWSRDYLVDEAHPNGVPEVFELKHERAVDNLKERAARASRNI